MTTAPAPPPPVPGTPADGRHDSEEPRRAVSPLELFFDLVFVFAVTQVTAYLADDPSGPQFVRGLLILASLWWAWGSYTWLANAAQSDEGLARLVLMTAMGAMLIVALAIPGAFSEHSELFALAYLALRAEHLLLYALLGRDDPALGRAVRRLATTSLPGPALLVVAGLFDGGLQLGLWIAALAIDIGGPLVRGVAGFQVEPGHFAERHGLIIIIALGESIMAIGVGAAGIDLGVAEVVAAALGLAAAAALWWAYFEVVALVSERRLAGTSGAERARLARDSYSYLHFFMVAGIVLMALGLKTVLAHAGDALHWGPAVGLCGGPALYLLAHVALRLRNLGTLNRQRLAAALALAALIPAAQAMPALAGLGIVVAVLVGLIAYETIRFADVRQGVRQRGEIRAS